MEHTTAAAAAPEPEIVHTLTLRKPIKFGSETISELRFREAIGKDMDELPAGGGDITMGAFRRIGARLCGRSPAELDGLHPKDALEVVRITDQLLGGDGPPTGETS
ncbi:MAG: phage tail assembly protein [Planctomycetota bacterium]